MPRMRQARARGHKRVRCDGALVADGVVVAVPWRMANASGRRRERGGALGLRADGSFTRLRFNQLVRTRKRYLIMGPSSDDGVRRRRP